MEKIIAFQSEEVTISVVYKKYSHIIFLAEIFKYFHFCYIYLRNIEAKFVKPSLDNSNAKYW